MTVHLWPARMLGAVIGLIGIVLTIGGVWLAWLGGSIYYVATGLLMIGSGFLLLRGKVEGGWLYLAIVAATIAWAFWETGGLAWALVPRVVAPLVLLILLIPAMAALSPRRGRWMAAGIAAVVLLGATVAGGFAFTHGYDTVGASGVPAPKIAAMSDPSAQTAGSDWPSYGGSQAARRFSPLNQITPANVDRLERVWTAHTRDLPSDQAHGTYGAENTPLKVGDTLYACTPKNVLIALDAANGKERWRHDPEVPDKAIPYTAACRGVVFARLGGADADQPCKESVIEGTLDARLIAVDAHTGQPCTAFGGNGEVSILPGMGDVRWGFVSITSPPSLVDGVLVVGHQVLDGQDRWSPSGVIQGFDARTGELRWAWDMVHPEWDRYPPPGQTWARGTPNMWTMASADEDLGLVYLPMGNSAVDYYSASRRPVENEWATSIVAIDVQTGKPRWRFQAVRKDVWDYDFGSQASLIDWPTPGGTVPALLVPSKQGDIYVLDRRNGEPLTEIGTIDAPGGGVEPAQRAKTQIVSRWHTLRKPPLTERDMWGMSPIDQMICRIQFRRAAYKGFYTPPTANRRSIEYPGYNGGTDWGGVAIDPRRGLIIANYNDMPNYVKLVPRAEANERGWTPRQQARGDIGGAEGAGDPQAHTPYAVDVNAGWRLPWTGMLCKQPPYGGIRAIDMHTGQTVWDRAFGEARTNGPFGVPSMLPVRIGTPNNGGAVVTAGGVIFIAAATDNLIRAIDIESGKVLWKDVLPGGGQATPVVYEQGGREFVAIYAGGHHFMETPVSDEIVAYALPQD